LSTQFTGRSAKPSGPGPPPGIAATCTLPESTPRPEEAICPKAGRQNTTTAKKFFIALCSTRNRISR
jgi:hypothetical protein